MYGYGGYQPTYYTPGQAMPGQLEQLRMNQQPNQQMMQQQTRPQSPMRCPPRSVKKPAPVLAGDMRSVRRLSACAAS